jgi:hypothetical protein
LYVKYLNNTSPDKSYISFDESRREITLRFNKLEAFTGYRTDPKTVYFQVELTPNAPQIGQTPILLYDIKAEANDTFITDRKIKLSNNNLTTKLSNYHDKDIKTGIVIEPTQ